MNIPVNEYQIYCTADTREKIGERIPILFLHGFAGSSADWAGIFPQIDSSFDPIAIDLIGHGQSSCPDDVKLYSSDSIVLQINKVLDYLSINKIIICGYSMGGRAALSFYLSHPDRVSGLILESANPGITNEFERQERIQNDSKLITLLKKGEIKDFIDYWYALPIFESFHSLPDEKISQILNSRYKNSVTGLRNSLAGFGTGTMPSYWNSLQDIIIPVQLIAGELDEKYISIHQKVNKVVLNSEYDTIEDAGHNTHLEKPIEFVSLINAFLRKNFV